MRVTIRSAQSQKGKLEERFARYLEEGPVADPELREIYEQDLAHRWVACRVRPADLRKCGAALGRGRAGAAGVTDEVAGSARDVLVGARGAHGRGGSVAAQQVGRYEDKDWRRAGLWRLRQAAHAPDLRMHVWVDLEADLEPLGEGPEAGAR